jgi:hypothetical protein
MTPERPSEPPSACQNKEEAIILLKEVLQLNSDLEYEMVLLWVAHTYMGGILPSEVCLYLAFDGPKSSGKSTATKIATYLAKNGKMITSITPSALKRLMDEGVTLGIDEIDAQSMSNDLLATLLRMGNSWDAKAGLSEYNGKKWVPMQTNIGGPKVFNFRGNIDDDALRSRCLVISMPSSKDSRMIIRGMDYKRRLKPVKDWIESEVSKAIEMIVTDAKFLKMTPQDYIQAEMEGELFIKKLDKIKPDLGRGVQQAALLLEISGIMGWDLETSIKEIVESQVNDNPFELETEIVANYYLAKHFDNHREGLDDSIMVSSEDLRSFVNQELDQRKAKKISKHHFSILKQELGWRDGINSRKSSRDHGKTILTFDETVLKNLGLEGQS